DSLLAKVIASGETRDDAIRHLSDALKGYHLLGLTTNIPFLKDIIKAADFQKGTHHTQSLKQMQDAGWQSPKASVREQAVALLAYHLNQSEKLGPWNALGEWRVTSRLGRGGKSYYYLPDDGDGNLVATVSKSGTCYLVQFGSAIPLKLEISSFINDEISIYYQSFRESFEYTLLRDGICLFGESGPVVLMPETAEAAMLGRRGQAIGGGNQVTAPMPGLVVELLAEVGQTVTKGQPLVVLEAMKLMQKLSASCDGVIEQISAAAGDTPEKGAVLITIKTDETAT
ncbi:MAG: biotin/lipoyl-binding protein, partial [Sneathiella sp.]|nr:biotin/lipoyl-binding protein [Sneathiella sp.]